MPYGLLYNTDTSEIRGVYNGDTTDVLLLQAVPADYGMLLMETLPDGDLLQYRIHEGLLLTKSVITLTPDVTSFPADGSTVCTITCGGVEATCTCVVNNTAYMLSAIDTEIEITSDVPQIFTVQVRDPYFYSAPVIVQAI